MKQALLNAGKVGSLPVWVRDVADAVMAGATLVPEPTWAKLGAWLNQLLEEDDLEDHEDEIKAAGFVLLQNHLRSQPHREWIDDALHRIEDENPGCTLWMIPVNELVSLYRDDEFGDDGIELYRLVFVGRQEVWPLAEIEKLMEISPQEA